MARKSGSISKKSTRKINIQQRGSYRNETVNPEIEITADITGRAISRIACDPKCGFLIQSSDEDEARLIIREHARNVHKMSISDADIKTSDMLPAGVG